MSSDEEKPKGVAFSLTIDPRNHPSELGRGSSGSIVVQIHSFQTDQIHLALTDADGCVYLDGDYTMRLVCSLLDALEQLPRERWVNAIEAHWTRAVMERMKRIERRARTPHA